MLNYGVDTSMGKVYVNDYTDNFKQYADFKAYYAEPAKLADKYNTLKEEKMSIAKNKRGLFQVILIDPKEKKMLLNTVVISDCVEDVLLEVDAGKVIKEAGLSVSDVDKIINILGQVRKTRKNKTGEVEIVNDDEENKQ